MFKEELIKKKFAIAFVAILAIVVCAVSFTACNGGNGDVKQLYGSIFELRDKLSEETTVSATELDDLNGTTVTVSGKALIAQRTDPDTNDVNYELWVGGTSRIYTGQIAPTAVADWCWYVNDTAMKTINVYTADAVNQFFEFKYDGNSVILPYVTGNVLCVDGFEVLEYDRQTDTVTEIGETTAGDEEPTLEPEGVMIELEDVDIELVGDTVAKVYDKSGKALRLVNMENLVPGSNAEVVAATKKAVLLQELKELPADASDYDFYEGADKGALVHYKYDWKSGKVTEAELGYVLYGDDGSGSGLLGLMTDIFSMSVAKIDGDKALVDGGVVFFDSDMNVVCDLNDIMPGATDIEVVGDLLKITDGAIVRYYDSEGVVVGEYVVSADLREDESGLLVKGNDYFTVSGEYVFTLGTGSADDTAVRYASVPGKIYYAEMNEIDPDAEPDPEASVGDFKVYDVATGASATICEIEKTVAADFDHGIYIISDGKDGYSVFKTADGSKLIDFSASDASVGMTVFGEDVLIEYSVTHVDGSVETEESRYILIDIETTSPELF